jgi:uncharacterized protein
MEEIIEWVKQSVKIDCEKYKEESEDKYDYWNDHIEYALEYGVRLAEYYHADKQIVELGIILHDIALIKKIGDRENHHIEGANYAREMLTNYNLDSSIIDRICGCVYNHRRGINSHNDEERCVSDADLLSHFKNIPFVFHLAYKKEKLDIPTARDRVKFFFKQDYMDLSESTKMFFKDEYTNLYRIIFDEEPDFTEKKDEIPFVWYSKLSDK